jgi:hypothetical protein
MPGFDGTGPRGAGPMTGMARGYCMLRDAGGEQSHLEGFVGAQGMPVDVDLPGQKEMTGVRMGDFAGPPGSRGITRRLVRYPAPSYGHLVWMGPMRPFGLARVAPPARFGWDRGFWRARFGRGFGRRGGGGRRRSWFGWFG